MKNTLNGIGCLVVMVVLFGYLEMQIPLNIPNILSIKRMENKVIGNIEMGTIQTTRESPHRCG
ncbi:hypothetical protein Musp01_02240 [Muricauda sp. NBRC 101325]|nr:hypothetical protein Musp01_02240 [Muricauda sp. NBRC 101325]